MVAGVLEGLHSFRRVSQAARRRAYVSTGVTLFMGLLVLSAPLLAGTALTLLLAGSFFVDGAQSALELWRRQEDRRTTLTRALAVVGNIAVAGLLLVLWWRTSPAGPSRWPAGSASSERAGTWSPHRSSRQARRARRFSRACTFPIIRS